MNNFLLNYYRKTIRLSPDGFSLYSIDDAGMVRSESFPANENALITKLAPQFFDLNQEGLKSLDIVVATHVPMLIPDILFDDQKAKEYLKLQYDITQWGQHFSDPMGQYRALYFLTQNEHSTVGSLNCRPRFRSEASLQYEFLKDQTVGDSVFLSVNNTFADILMCSNGHPVLLNRTHRMDVTDLLYFTLNGIQQFSLTSPTVYVHHFGKANKKLSDLFAKYINNIILL